MTTPSSSSLQPGLARPILASILGRSVLNTAHRLVYPFLPIIARGLGVPLEAAASLVALRSSFGFAGLAIGPLADRLRRRTLILFALGLFTLSAFLAAAVPLYLVFAIGFLGMGLAKTILDPTTVAYLADRVPYALRGRVTGILETPWALAGLVGLPVAGWAIARWGWQAPYWGLAILGILSLLIAHWAFPAGGVRPRPPAGSRFWHSYLTAWQTLNVRWMWLSVFCLVMGNDLVYIISGAWLEREYGLGAAALGAVSIATGLAELAGEGVSSALLDRVGKKRGILAGIVLLLLTYPLLPLLGGQGLVGAIIALSLILLLFEFAYISCIPLVTELVPSARATTIGVIGTASQMGRVLGAALGPLLWQSSGLWTNIGLAVVLTLAAAILLATRVHE